MDRFPLVSVILPTYNRESFLEKSISSVLNQTYTNIELIIIDDGSFDGSHLIFKTYEKDPRVKVFYQKNLGVASARNFGLQSALGKYITFIDSDDFFFPRKIENQLKYIQKFDFPVVLSCGFQLFNNEKESKGRLFPIDSSSLIKDLINKNPKVYARTPLLFIEKSFIKKHEINFDIGLTAMEDWDFLFQLSQKNIVYKALPEVLVGVNDHLGPRVHNLRDVFLAELKLIKKYKSTFWRYPFGYFIWSRKISSIYYHYDFFDLKEDILNTFSSPLERTFFSIFAFFTQKIKG